MQNYKYLIKKEGHILTGFDENSEHEAKEYAKKVHGIVIINNNYDKST